VTEPQASEPDDTARPHSDPEGAAEAAASSKEAVELSIEQLLELLEDTTKARDEYLALAQRTQADFENHRKLAQRRVEDEVQRVTGGLVERLLPVLDACDSAVAHGAAEVEPIASALALVLEKEGLTRIDPIGEPFDPTVADAVVHEPGDGGDHVVSEVLRAGYAWHGRTLRPAMVKVTD
jgi:molecular chaperone GrpE